MYSLSFHIQPKSHPYDYEPASQFESWTHMSLIVSGGGIQHTLITCEWNIAVLVEWFIHHYSHLLDEPCQIDGTFPHESESIAQAMERFYAREFPDDDEENEEAWFTSLFEYQTRHALRFALRGVDLPNIYIGINPALGDISLVNTIEQWHYTFDMDAFCRSTCEELKTCLGYWLNQRLSPRYPIATHLLEHIKSFVPPEE